ncbi:MAG: hypothetical protein KJP08_03105 [Gammaproteobacteria bacterium]|nr:hypothetical protein [Gammaproteobacteria bacterium]NNF48413.1 hypothetical protein [Woeseiaceae bacterium]MBT8093773.1 hypothetical protein [Gammaproteobacteria bacterium]MBT8104870.1 hypothetical protein [Gammaproteobacteria bacterium]NNK24884.1 hypothetical protein [Woeseiaceae bacterium]
MSRDGFDADAMVRDDGDNGDLPYLTLEVDRLTAGKNGHEGPIESPPADAEPAPDTPIPTMSPGVDGLEVYGWESSLWRKIRGYLGL